MNTSTTSETRTDIKTVAKAVPHVRPVFHFTPRTGWLNDPNGLIHHRGEWHLFYQYHPESLDWGPMHWGHAVSRDLIDWEHLPIALTPDEHGTIFSGSVVVDHDGSAGYGTEAMLAYYTYHLDGDRSQALAYSLDAGRTWAKHADNPILLPPDDGPDFRDPKVFHYQHPSGGAWWVMLLAAGSVLRFYRSDDLLHWAPTSTFTDMAGSPLGVFETPELFELPIDDGAERTWVLSVGHLTGGPHSGSGSRYLIGAFDGERFTAAGGSTEPRWSDHGADFYAAQSWTDSPDGRRVWIGWMNNWAYANTIPATTWRGMMSTPRELSLATLDKGQIVLVQRPVRELDSYRMPIAELHEPDLQTVRQALERIRGVSLDIHLEVAFPHDADGDLQLIVHGHSAGGTVVSYDPASRQAGVDRSRSGATIDPQASTRHPSAPLPLDGNLQLRIIVDTNSVEVFAGNGVIVISDLVFPDPDATEVRLDRLPSGATITQLTIYALTVPQTPHPQGEAAQSLMGDSTQVLSTEPDDHHGNLSTRGAPHPLPHDRVGRKSPTEDVEDEVPSDNW